jgi:hypothetical protein
MAFVAGCVGPTYVIQQYSGAPRPPESIAILRINGSDSVRLLSVDGENVAAPLASDARLHVELLIGRHRITLANASAARPREIPLDIDVEPNKVYRVVFDPAACGAPCAQPPAPDAAPARLFEVDRSTDALGRDVTLTNDAEKRREVLPPP